MLRYGSVCSGIEAATVAWHPLGWTPAWFSEIEPFPCAVLAERWPRVPNLGDMTTITTRVLNGEVEAPDVLVGGTPCQAFSVAGAREGLDDERGQLTLAFARLADAIDTARARRGQQPCIIVWENVPGVYSSKDNAFGSFLGLLSGEGEALVAPGKKWSNAGAVFGPARTIAWRTLDAQFFGVAQRRRRCFLVASARNIFDPASVLFEREGVRRDSPPRRAAREEIATGTLRCTDGGSDVDHARAGHLQPAVSPWPAEVASTLDSHFGDKWGLEDQHVNSCCPLFVPACAQCVTGDVTHALKGEGCDGSEDGTGRGQPIVAIHGMQDPDVLTEAAHTLGRNSGQENAIFAAHTHTHTHTHTIAVRRITPREAERLQGFPDDHTNIVGAKDTPRYKAIGNSMAVPVMHWIGKRIAEDLELYA